MRPRFHVELPEIPLSEARRRWSELLRTMEDDPDAGYRITVRGSIAAEIRKPTPPAGRAVRRTRRGGS